MNTEFFFSKISCITKAKKHSLAYYVAIARWLLRRDGCIPFPRAFALYETQTASSLIRTWVADFIYNDDDRYAKLASLSSIKNAEQNKTVLLTITILFL